MPETTESRFRAAALLYFPMFIATLSLVTSIYNGYLNSRFVDFIQRNAQITVVGGGTVNQVASFALDGRGVTLVDVSCGATARELLTRAPYAGAQLVFAGASLSAVTPTPGR